MHIDRLERRWVYLTSLLALTVVGVLAGFAVGDNINPPSNVETIDSARLHLSDEFAEDKLGVTSNPDGSFTVHMVAARYGFYPRTIEVPANTPVTFRIASMDVLHGIHGALTNLNTMVVPGYVSEVTTAFPKAGEYPMVCNEFCGLGHDHMWSKLIVTEPAG